VFPESGPGFQENGPVVPESGPGVQENGPVVRRSAPSFPRSAPGFPRTVLVLPRTAPRRLGDAPCATRTVERLTRTFLCANQTGSVAQKKRPDVRQGGRGVSKNGPDPGQKRPPDLRSVRGVHENRPALPEKGPALGRCGPSGHREGIGRASTRPGASRRRGGQT
jgi:hypothetical protein